MWERSLLIVAIILEAHNSSNASVLILNFGVLHICQQFKVEPQDTLLVGDYLFDLLSAKAAGAVAVLLANQEGADEFAKHADFVIEKIDEVLQIIEKSKN